jgi:hypothetical protein
MHPLVNVSKVEVLPISEVLKCMDQVAVRCLWDIRRRQLILFLILGYKMNPQQDDGDDKNTVAAHVRCESYGVPWLVPGEEDLRSYREVSLWNQ